MSIEQCRAARALLNWSADDLAKVAVIGVATVRRFESGQVVQAGSIARMKTALEAAGVTFISVGQMSRGGGTGVRLTIA